VAGAVAIPATTTETPAQPIAQPKVREILKHLALSLLMANVIPGLLFYLALRIASIWVALIVALVWCYGAIAWRFATKRPPSGLLMISVVGLTAKTIFAFASGSTFIYFLQPAVNDAIVASLFLLSLATARPIVARLATDFFPLSPEVAGRPRIQRLFWHLTVLWAVICLTKCGVTLYLLESMPPVQFVAIKSILILVVIIAGTAVTVEAARRVAKSEGLLYKQPA
jgi:hypothetical protein